MLAGIQERRGPLQAELERELRTSQFVAMGILPQYVSIISHGTVGGACIHPCAIVQRISEQLVRTCTSIGQLFSLGCGKYLLERIFMFDFGVLEGIERPGTSSGVRILASRDENR